MEGIVMFCLYLYYIPILSWIHVAVLSLHWHLASNVFTFGSKFTSFNFHFHLLSFVSLRLPAWVPPSQYQRLPQRLSLSRTLRPMPIMATMVTNFIYIYMRGISKVT